jgi:hypothetical protein
MKTSPGASVSASHMSMNMGSGMSAAKCCAWSLSFWQTPPAPPPFL